MHYQHGPITTVAAKWAAPRLWSGAGLGPEDVDVTGSYEAFTFTTMLQLEDYGFCSKGEGGAYVSSGAIELGGRRPNNTSGGHLCEGYTHGVSMVVENVRQLRHDADDSCPIGADGRLYISSEDGEIYVISATPDMKQIAKNDMKEVIMSTPAIADGLIVVRTMGHLYGIGQ